MSLLRRFFLIVGLFLFAGAGIGLLLPSKWTVVESIHIEAPPERVHQYIADLKRWREWDGSPPDSETQGVWTYSGEPMTPGSSMEWHFGNVGQGRLEITEADPATGVAYTLRLEDRFDGWGRFEYTPDDRGTLVTWTDVGDMGSAIPVRYFLLFKKDDLGENFVLKLNALKTLIESEASGAPQNDAEERDDLLSPPPKAEIDSE